MLVDESEDTNAVWTPVAVVVRYLSTSPDMVEIVKATWTESVISLYVVSRL